jgi:hypothetical protein
MKELARPTLNRSLDAPQSLLDYFEEQKTLLPLPGFEPRVLFPPAHIAGTIVNVYKKTDISWG